MRQLRRVLAPLAILAMCGALALADGAGGDPSAPSKLQVFDGNVFVSPGRTLGVALACLGGTTPCTGTLTLTRGGTLYASRTLNLPAETGGFAHFQLSSAAMRKLFPKPVYPAILDLNVTSDAGQQFTRGIYVIRWY